MDQSITTPPGRDKEDSELQRIFHDSFNQMKGRRRRIKLIDATLIFIWMGFSYAAPSWCLPAFLVMTIFRLIIIVPLDFRNLGVNCPACNRRVVSGRSFCPLCGSSDWDTKHIYPLPLKCEKCSGNISSRRAGPCFPVHYCMNCGAFLTQVGIECNTSGFALGSWSWSKTKRMPTKRHDSNQC